MRRVHVALAVLFIVLVLTVLIIAARADPTRASIIGRAVVLGGGLTPRVLGGGEPGPTGHHPRDLHPIGDALGRYARELGPEHVVAVHPLDRNGYEPLSPIPPAAASGGAAGKKPPLPKKRWAEYATWPELRADPGAVAEYFAQRARAINNPDFDWSPVLREMAPRLGENREYIGLIDVEEDGRTLRLSACEASPIEAGTMKSDVAFAAVPAELVAKYAEKPALFMFHTHPSDPRGSPLPSSHDLSTAAFFAATGRFAASVVISRYGPLLYTLDWDGYKAINEAKDWDLAVSNLGHDIVAAHEAVRSWSSHTLADYLAFYPRHRLLFVAWPSADMVAEGRRFTYLWDLETPIDHELITEHRDDALRHMERLEKKSRSKGQPGSRIHARAPPPKVDLGLD